MLMLVSASCNTLLQKEPVLGDGSDMPVDLMFSLTQGTVVPTKADYSNFTELTSTTANPHFRGLTDVRVLPFYTGMNNPVQAGSQSNGYARLLPDISSDQDAKAYDGQHFHDGLLTDSHAHLYSSADASLPSGTTAVLAYGRAVPLDAATSLEWKQLNGSLLESGWEWQPTLHYASDITFSPEHIYGDDAAQVAQALADIITAVATVTYTRHYYYYYNDAWEEADVQLRWDSTLENAGLKNAFLSFIENSGVFSGSGSNLAYRLSVLYAFLKGFSADDNTTPYLHERGGNAYPALTSSAGEQIKWGQLYNGLRDALLDKLENWTGVLNVTSEATLDFTLAANRSFPRQFGLPDGAAVLRWNGAQVVPVVDGFDDAMPARRYCFMPPLYYYVNTPVSTSFDRYIYEMFSGKDWSQVLTLYDVGKIVTHDIKAVALDRPLQYACGMVEATVEGTVTSLPDNDGNDLTNVPLDASTNHFPLTGIIIGGQYPQHFDFTPVTDDSSSDLLEEGYMYDSHVPGVYLRYGASASVRTLCLPTPLSRAVYFLLEFSNNSGIAFCGADGTVPPGSRFYLAGKMEKPSATDISDGFNRVVMQDHYTTIHCRVSSLENAYLTVPQMGNPELLLGIQVQVNWEFSQASHLVME